MFQQSLNLYPYRPGSKGTDTSEAAARKIHRNSRAELLRNIILQELENGPATNEEIAERIKEDITSVRPRMSQLRRMGLIDDSGKRISNEKGNLVIIWTRI